MLVLLSPAKTLDSRPWDGEQGFANKHLRFENEADEIVNRLIGLSVKEFKGILSLSDELAGLNRERMKNWKSAEAKPCIFMYDGPAFKSFEAPSLSSESLNYGQQHLRIISGMYGLLAPLDSIKPYRLEMATKLQIQDCKNLYSFWKRKITDRLKRELDEQPEGERFIINCASQEYSKAIDCKSLGYPIVEIKFPGPSVFAKAARGAMARYCITQRVTSVQSLKDFTGRDEEWHFDANKSTESVLVFERRQKSGKQKATESKPTRKRKESSAGPQPESKRSK